MLFALLSGVLIAVMVAVNGTLTDYFDVYFSAVVIHVVGTAFALLLCLIKREPLFRKVPRWAFLGGSIGIFTTLFNNYAYSRISMTSIIALSLLGQTVTSAVIDRFGLLGMKKHPIGKATWIGMAISFAGVAVMLDASVAGAAVAVLLSLAAGVTNVLSRSVNAKLAEKVGNMAGSFYNHLAGLPLCLLLWLLLTDRSFGTMPKPWMLSGGMLGVLILFLSNVAVPHVSAFYYTLLTFIGQIFTGFLLDLLCGSAVSGGLFWGSLLCAAGFLVSVLLSLWEKGARDRQDAYSERRLHMKTAHQQKLRQTQALRVLARVAKCLNDAKITWAVGGSLLLYFNGITEVFHDLDLMIFEKDALRAKEILGTLGTLQPSQGGGRYRTKHFYEFSVEGVDIDLMGGFAICSDGVVHTCALEPDQIVGSTSVEGQTIPLQSVALWRTYYEWMERTEKVAMIDAAEK